MRHSQPYRLPDVKSLELGAWGCCSWGKVDPGCEGPCEMVLAVAVPHRKSDTKPLAQELRVHQNL